MLDIERFLEEKLNPVYRAHYALWVYWWPLWRSMTGRSILRKWEQSNLVCEGQTFLDYGFVSAVEKLTVILDFTYEERIVKEPSYRVESERSWPINRLAVWF